MTWKRQVEEESVKVGLRGKDNLCRSKWSVNVNKITVGHPHLLGLLPEFRYFCLSQDMTLLMPAHYASRSTLYLHHTYWGYYHSLDIGVSLKI